MLSEHFRSASGTPVATPFISAPGVYCVQYIFKRKYNIKVEFPEWLVYLTFVSCSLDRIVWLDATLIFDFLLSRVHFQRSYQI